MIRVIYICLSILIIAACASAQVQTAVGTTNRVVMVDQDGQFNIPVLATQAQLSTNAAIVAIASAKAEAANQAAAEGTNMIADIVAQIAASELVVYRQGYIDSITSDVALPPDTKCLITKMDPNVGTDPSGKIRSTLTYATTRTADGIAPDILYSSTITSGVKGMTPIAPGSISAVRKLNKTFTSSDGSLFPYMYEVDILLDPSPSGFFIIYLNGDASASGAVFEITGGIAGGVTADIPFGDKILSFKGGLLISVKEGAAQ